MLKVSWSSDVEKKYIFWVSSLEYKPSPILGPKQGFLQGETTPDFC